MFKPIIFSMSLSLALTLKPTDCPCKKFPFTREAEWGHMTTIVFDEKPVNKIRGRVADRLNEPIPNARVYVWRKPVSILDEEFSSSNLKSKDRVVACRTEEDGKFCFDNIPPGKYVVCAIGTGFNSTCVLVTLKPKSKRKGFDIVLDMGT